MRLVVWNCRMALHKKADALVSLRPDVAVIPESSDPGVLPGAKSTGWVGPEATKGLSAVSFGAYSLKPKPRQSDDLPDALAFDVAGPVAFTLVAVWTRGPGYIRRLHDVVDAWEPLLRSGDAVIAGDFNSNTIWDKLHGDRCHSAMVRRLDSDFGLVSAYHVFKGEAHGAETTKTFYMYGHQRFTYHIDYVFLPRRWRERLRGCEVGASVLAPVERSLPRRGRRG